MACGGGTRAWRGTAAVHGQRRSDRRPDTFSGRTVKVGGYRLVERCGKNAGEAPETPSWSWETRGKF